MVKKLTLDDILEIIGDEIARLDKRLDSLIEKSSKSKYLTLAQKQEICESQESVKSLSIKFNRTRQQIYNIKKNGNLKNKNF